MNKQAHKKLRNCSSEKVLKVSSTSQLLDLDVTHKLSSRCCGSRTPPYVGQGPMICNFWKWSVTVRTVAFSEKESLDGARMRQWTVNCNFQMQLLNALLDALIDLWKHFLQTQEICNLVPLLWLGYLTFLRNVWYFLITLKARTVLLQKAISVTHCSQLLRSLNQNKWVSSTPRRPLPKWRGGCFKTALKQLMDIRW